MPDQKIEEVEVVESSSGGKEDRFEDIQVNRRKRVVENLGVEYRQNLRRVTQFIWLMFGTLEGLLGLRFVLKLIGANPGSPFAQALYRATDLFLWPFRELVFTPTANGFVLEIYTVIAMFVYALVAYVLVNLVWIIFMRTNARTVTVYERHRQ
jgi:YggT family protein